MEFLIYFTTTMPYSGEYKRKVSHFAKFMNWKFNPNPPYNTKTSVQYPREQLLQITDEDVATWLTIQAYGKTNPGPTDCFKERRHSSLLQYIKAISEFMINKRHEWDEVKHHGNPTRSEAVRKMLKKVEELEARKLGAKERKRRPFTGAEFEAVIQMIEEWSSELKDMEILEDDQVGSHSIRKYASIKARRFGCTKDDVDYRARWKGKKRQQDEYTITA